MQGIEHDLDKTRLWVEESNITMPLEQMNGKLDGWKEKERRRRMTTLANKIERACLRRKG